MPSQFFLLSLVPKNTNQKVVLSQGKRAQLLHVTTPAGSATFANPPSPQDNAEHQELERELEVRWAHFLDCYIHRQRARGMYKCHRLGISGLLKHKDTVCKVDQATADKVSHKAFSFFFFSGTKLSFFIGTPGCPRPARRRRAQCQGHFESWSATRTNSGK